MFLEFVQQQWPLFLALIIIVSMLVFSYVGDRLQGYRNVDTTEATRLINDGAAVFDVRSESEYAGGHLVDAVNIPVSQLKSRIEKDALSVGKQDPMLVYCASGSRSARACAQLARAGYEKVHNLSGGIMAWQNAGLPLEKGGRKKGKKKAKKS